MKTQHVKYLKVRKFEFFFQFESLCYFVNNTGVLGEKELLVLPMRVKPTTS